MMCASGSTRQVVGVNQHRSLKGCLKRLLGTFGCATINQSRTAG